MVTGFAKKHPWVSPAMDHLVLQTGKIEHASQFGIMVLFEDGGRWHFSPEDLHEQVAPETEAPTVPQEMLAVGDLVTMLIGTKKGQRANITDIKNNNYWTERHLGFFTRDQLKPADYEIGDSVIITNTTEHACYHGMTGFIDDIFSDEDGDVEVDIGFDNGEMAAFDIQHIRLAALGATTKGISVGDRVVITGAAKKYPWVSPSMDKLIGKYGEVMSIKTDAADGAYCEIKVGENDFRIFVNVLDLSLS